MLKGPGTQTHRGTGCVRDVGQGVQGTAAPCPLSGAHLVLPRCGHGVPLLIPSSLALGR